MSYDRLGLALKERDASPHPEELQDFIEHEHPADLARFAEEWPPRDAWRVMDLLPFLRQAEVFGYLPREFQVDMADAVARDRLARLVTEMNADERADLYNELSEGQRTALLPALSQAEREDIRRLASYPPDTAGAIMTSDYAVLTAELSASEALQKLRDEALDQETIYRTYVIDAERRLLGSVRLQDLFLAPAKARVSDVMERNTHAVTVTDDKELVAQRVARYDLLAFLRDIFTGTTIERVTRTAGRLVLMANAKTAERWRKVFIATDMSETSGYAARKAHELGLLEGADVTFVHGYAPITRQMMTHAGIPAERVHEEAGREFQSTRRELGRFIQGLNLGDLSYNARIIEGVDADVIAGLVEQAKPDLLVIGTRGLSGVKRLFLGRLAQELMGGLEIDVLAVPPQA